jgi:hypothetical protein
MGKRDLAVTILVVAALIAVAPTADAGVNVLVLPDGPGAGVESLRLALIAAGHTVTVGPIEYTWDGTNPSTDGYYAVVHFNGKTFDYTMPVAGQQALVDFVRFGGGYVGGQWNGWERWKGYLLDMDDLVLQEFLGTPGGSNNCETCWMTWTIVPGMEEHPMFQGVDESFEFFAGAHDAAPLVEFEEYPSTVLMTAPAGGPAVTIREFEYGRVVTFSSAANQNSEDTMLDPNIQRLYINAVTLATALPQAPPAFKLEYEIGKLVESGALKRGQANALMSKLKAAMRQIARNNFSAAAKHMWRFVGQVEKWIRTGVLTVEEGAPLLEIAHEIIDSLNG